MMEPAVESSPSTLTFGADSTVRGFTGCNHFSGTAEIGGETIAITLGPMTMAACADPALTAQETALVQLLPMATTYAFEGDVLTLRGVGNVVLATYTPADNGIVETTWTVTGVNTGSAVESSALTETLTAEFNSDGAFSGFGGCNRLVGTFETSGTEDLTISGIGATMMACGDAESAVEAQYTDALEQVAKYQVDGDTLTLRDTDGAMQVTARRG